MFNDSSCVACHNQGGVGGGGSASKNVEIISAFTNQQEVEQRGDTLPSMIFRAFFGGFASESVAVEAPATVDQPDVEKKAEVAAPAPAEKLSDDPARRKQQLAEAKNPKTNDQAAMKKALLDQQHKEIAAIHPGFLTARSLVLHRFGVDADYEAWRTQINGMNRFTGGQMFVAPPVSATPATVVTETAVASADAVEVALPPIAGTPAVTGSIIVTGTVTLPAQPMPSTQDFQVQAQAEQQMQQQRALSQFRAQELGPSQVGNLSFIRSQRNATALFGIGAIDRVTDDELRAAAAAKFKDFPEIHGRVSKMKDGKLGRFGWKAQKSSLEDFALTACSVELGLEVPNHPQAIPAQKPNYKAPGQDMNQAECDALVQYLRDLTAPSQRKPADKTEAAYLAAGEKQFAAVGCACCHAAKLGQTAGMYSDLLLHDMGDDLGDTGNYGIFVPNSEDENVDEPLPSLASSAPFGGLVATKATDKTIGALRHEWRTPPLWGVRDSAPYLHDGRADTLEQAIAFHGGESKRSAQKFFALKAEDRLQLISFLKSLTAPEPTKVASAK